MKTTLWIVFGCLGVTVLVVTGIVLSVIYGTREPEDIQVKTRIPLEAQSDPFTLEISITNSGKKAQKLNSIDIDQEYLKGISITSAEPNYTESNDWYFFQSYLFERSIAPGKTLIVTFAATPVHAGDFAGDLDVCVGVGSRCITSNIRTIVREAEAQESPFGR